MGRAGPAALCYRVAPAPCYLLAQNTALTLFNAHAGSSLTPQPVRMPPSHLRHPIGLDDSPSEVCSQEPVLFNRFSKAQNELFACS